MTTFEYSIWYWDNGSVYSGYINACCKFIAKRKLNKILKRGFRNTLGFHIRPNQINKYDIREKKK